MKKLLPFVIDALLVIVFCLIGRRSHHEAVITGLFRTLWPFALGLILGWAVAVADFTRRDTNRTESGRHQFGPVLTNFDARPLWPAGVTIWLCTVLGGMALRVMAGQGIAFTFVLVALAVLALFLLGWRAAWKALS
ncbi:DUF3054 domain-containing protein [Nocardia alni]|uniref:DUF3054 domain-containing protein n=1 Tax=Nocardia alni TaxID=2815723 RepID=UPI001C231126|nr:DUF3054 domain-containing protein [Nocardia alni]